MVDTMDQKEPTLEQMAELYIALTDTFPAREMTEKVLEARQQSFEILINAGSMSDVPLV